MQKFVNGSIPVYFPKLSRVTWSSKMSWIGISDLQWQGKRGTFFWLLSLNPTVLVLGTDKRMSRYLNTPKTVWLLIIPTQMGWISRPVQLSKRALLRCSALPQLARRACNWIGLDLHRLWKTLTFISNRVSMNQPDSQYQWSLYFIVAYVLVCVDAPLSIFWNQSQAVLKPK